MSIDPSFRSSGRIAGLAGSNMQSAEDKILEDPAVNSQQGAAPPKLQNQNAEAANSRRADAGMMANQLQSQLLNQTNSTGANRTSGHKTGSDGAALQRALKMYAITNEQLQRYIVTGEEPEGLKKAINDARTKGGWPALNIVRSSFQMRADYLRANSGPDDKQSRAEADQLDAASASLTRNSNEIQLKRAKDRLETLSNQYPDYSTRPANIQKEIDQARKEIEYISSDVADQVNVRLGK